MARKIKQTELGTEIQCTKCGEYYPADNDFFHRYSRQKFGLHTWCKSCVNETRRNRYYEKKEYQKVRK